MAIFYHPHQYDPYWWGFPSLCLPCLSWDFPVWWQRRVGKETALLSSDLVGRYLDLSMIETVGLWQFFLSSCGPSTSFLVCWGRLCVNVCVLDFIKCFLLSAWLHDFSSLICRWHNYIDFEYEPALYTKGKSYRPVSTWRSLLRSFTASFWKVSTTDFPPVVFAWVAVRSAG